MKILEVIFTLCSGGAERVVVNLCNGFAERGHEVTLLTVRDIDVSPILSFNKQFLSENVHLKSLKAKYPTPGALFRISKLMKELKPDVVHLHLNVLPFFFPIIFFGNSKVLFFHTIHNVAKAACGYKGQRPINRWLYNTGKIIPITISNLCNQSYQEFYHLPAATMIENGASKPIPTNSVSDVHDEIERLKHHPDDKVFIQVGTVGPIKNQALSIRVFRTLLEEKYHAVLLLLGKDNSEQKEYCDQVRRDCPSNCFFLGEKSNVADYLVNSDYFVMPSQYEGLPISLLEAMACGCIPVCTAVGGIPDVITNEKNGHLIALPEYDDLLKMLKTLLSGEERICRNDVVQYYNANYDSNIYVEKYLNLFQRK